MQSEFQFNPVTYEIPDKEVDTDFSELRICRTTSPPPQKWLYLHKRCRMCWIEWKIKFQIFQILFFELFLILFTIFNLKSCAMLWIVFLYSWFFFVRFLFFEIWLTIFHFVSNNKFVMQTVVGHFWERGRCVCISLLETGPKILLSTKVKYRTLKNVAMINSKWILTSDSLHIYLFGYLTTCLSPS